MLEDRDFRSRLLRAIEANEVAYQSSDHVEEQLYQGGFWSEEDEHSLVGFNEIRWEERFGIEFTDRRLRRFARHLFYFERPDLLPLSDKQAIEREIARRLLGLWQEPPWLTIPAALVATESVIGETSGEARLRLERYRSYLKELATRLGEATSSV